MRNRNLIVLAGLAAVLVLGVAGWYFISPLFIDETVDEALPQASVPEPSTTAAEEDAMAATMTVLTPKSMDQPMPDEVDPTVLRRGTFVDADAFHLGSGTATVLELSDGERILRFEDFSVTNGPDLHVLLAAGSSPTSQDDLGEYVDLGELKGNLGNQNYNIEDTVDLEKFKSVVIYCVPFHVVFSTAALDE